MPRCSCRASLTSSSARLTARSRFASSSEMSEGQEEERFLPRCLERGVVADVDPFECEPERLGILRECLSGSAMDCARELIEYDDKGKTRPWALRPVVQFAPFAARANNGENRSIISESAPRNHHSIWRAIAA